MCRHAVFMADICLALYFLRGPFHTVSVLLFVESCCIERCLRTQLGRSRCRPVLMAHRSRNGFENTARVKSRLPKLKGLSARGRGEFGCQRSHFERAALFEIGVRQFVGDSRPGDSVTKVRGGVGCRESVVLDARERSTPTSATAVQIPRSSTSWDSCS